MNQPMPAENTMAEAARWFARRRSGDLSPAEARELEAWLAADSAHREAFHDLQVAWRDVETMRDDPRIMAMRAEATAVRPLRRRVLGGAIAAGMAAALAGLAMVGGRELLWDAHRYTAQTYQTGIGQRATVTLPDGTVVTLNTDSRLRTRGSADRRLVYLDRGQAFFKVAHDKAHPFVVAAAGKTVTALGTAFDVRVDDGRMFKVTLVEGRVRVEAPPPAAPPRGKSAAAPPVQGQAIEMVAGAELVARDDNKWDLARADVRRDTSWTTGQLVFYATPLRQVVTELNRYSEKKIVLGDEPFAERPISGTFRTGDVETFARGLETYRMARIENDTANVLVLAAPREN